MKYQQPWGNSNPDASYINGDPSIGRQGSIPPAAVFEQPQREIVNLIRNSQQTPSDEDLEQLTRGVRDGKLNYCRDTGPLNQFQVKLTPPLRNYEAGLVLRVIASHTVTGPTTLAADALNPVAVKRRDGAELKANDVVAGQIATLVFDGTSFQLQNMGVGEEVEAPEPTIYRVDIPYVRDTSESTAGNNLIGMYSPPIPDIIEGRTVEIKLQRAVTGPTTFTPNNFPTHPVARPDGSPVQAGDGVSNQIWLLVFDSEQWQIVNSRFDLPAIVEPGLPAEPKLPTGRSLQFYYGTGFEPWPGPLNTASCLQRYPSLNTNRQIWTFSAFIRRNNPKFVQIFDTKNAYSTGSGCECWWSAGGSQAGSDATLVYLTGSTQGNNFTMAWGNSGSIVAGLGGSAFGGATFGYTRMPVFEDPQWHHWLWNCDGAMASVFVDGVLFLQGPTGGRNGAVNAANRPHCIGSNANDIGRWYGSTVRMAEVLLVDGQCLDWKTFAESIGGVIVPKTFTGNYGPNGFLLNWQDSTAATSTTLGKDWSGNGNDYQPINFNVNAVMADYPGKID